MDKDLLIAAVFGRTPIWDKRDKLHSNRNIIDKYWRDISAEMKEDEAKVRKQWKYLRDQFSVELGKYPPPRSGDAAEDTPTSKWPYFTQLLFLKDIVKPRATSGNLSNTQKCTQETQPEENQSFVEREGNSGNEESSHGSEHDHRNVTENSGTLPTSGKTSSALIPVTAKKRRGKTDSFNASVLEIERRKLEYLESKSKRSCFSDQDDEHLSFFKSLLPHVRKIPENRILSFRCRVQELVDQFSYQLNIFSRPSSSTSSYSCAPSPISNTTDQHTHTSPPLNQQLVTCEIHNADFPEPITGNQQQNTSNRNDTFSLSENNIFQW